jgi:hypothetical protein
MPLYKCSQCNQSVVAILVHLPFACCEELKGTKCGMFGEYSQQTRPDWLWANTASLAMGTGLRPRGVKRAEHDVGNCTSI